MTAGRLPDIAHILPWQSVTSGKHSVIIAFKRAIIHGFLLEDLDLTIVTPSNWLAGLVGKSFLKDFPVQVIHNGINLSIFQPRKSSFRQKYGLENKKLVLGVSFDWGRKKGLDVFVSLAARLPDEYKIILIGISEATEKQLPKNILSL